MFKLVNSETKPLTTQLAEEFVNLLPSPTERSFDQARAKMLREKAEHGQLIALNGSFPEGLKAHIDTYKVDTQDDLAELFRQFDSRKSGRTPNDVAGAYQGL